MTEALFFEILTAQSGSTTRQLFAKFPPRENPVAIVSHSGTLLKHEVDTRSPASPAERLRLKSRFELNKGLADGSFVLSEQHRQGIADWTAYQEEAQDSLVERYATIQHLFPHLATFKSGDNPDPVLEVQHAVSTDPTLVGSLYEQIRKPGYPTTAEITPAWAFYRWLQVQLLYCLEYFRRYGPSAPRDQIGKGLANDVVDAQYVTTAALSDGLATGDAQVAQFFAKLRPSSELRLTNDLADRRRSTPTRRNSAAS